MSAKPVQQNILFIHFEGRLRMSFVGLSSLLPLIFWSLGADKHLSEAAREFRLAKAFILFPIYMLGSDIQQQSLTGNFANLRGFVPSYEKNYRRESSGAKSRERLLRCFGALVALWYLSARCIIFLKRRAKQQSSSLYDAVKQTPTRLYFKPPPLSIEPHYIMTRARAPRRYCSLALQLSFG